MAGPGLDHVNVVVADIDRSAAFYTRLLDLEIVMDRMLEGDWFAELAGPGARARCVILDRPGGGCRIELLAFPSPVTPATLLGPDGRGLRHFAIRVPDLDRRLRLYHELTGERVLATEVPAAIVRGGKRMAYLRDLDGAIIELAEYGADRPEFR